MTGAVIGLTALIPVAGAYIGAAFGILIIFTVSPVKAVVYYSSPAVGGQLNLPADCQGAGYLPQLPLVEAWAEYLECF